MAGVNPSTTAVRGYSDFMRAVRRGEKQSRRVVRDQYRQVGEIVRVDAEHRLSKYDAGSAAALKTRVRQGGVSVEQTKRRTTGKRLDYAKLQMRRALLPALAAKQAEVEEQYERAIDRIADEFERR